MMFFGFVVVISLLSCLLSNVSTQKMGQENGKSSRSLQSLRHEVDLIKFVEAINVTLDSTVDADLQQLSRVYRPGNICPFQRSVVSKMQKEETVKVLIVGGSVTYGADLPDRMGQRWSTSFTNIMNSGWYKGNFEINNIGVGACNIDVWIDRVNEMKNADIVIMDLSVNDQGFDLQALPHLYRTFIQLVDSLPNHPAFLFHQAFRTGAYDKREWGYHCPHEADQGSCCGGFLWCKRWWDMQDFVAITLHRFGIPFVSYRDLCWPEYDKPPPTLNQWWNGMSHPDPRAHKMIAKLIAYGFMRQVKDAHIMNHCDLGHDQGRYVARSELDDSIHPVCSTSLTRLFAGESLESVSSITPIAHAAPIPPVWRYFNDSQLKFGWILSSDQMEADIAQGSSRLSFQINLGVSPRLQISFLKSYDKRMGTIAMWLDDEQDEGKKMFIDGHWDLEYSVTHVITFTRERLTNISTLVLGQAEVMPSLTTGAHTLNFAFPANKKYWKDKFKWKLIGIMSC